MFYYLDATYYYTVGSVCIIMKTKLTINFNKILFHCFLVVILGFFSVIAAIFILSRDLPSLEQLENYDPDLVTRIYSSDGVVLNEL